jgi:hypothetical protein
MKNKYLYIILIAGVLSSCFKDKGNYVYTEHEEITVTGIAASYDKISLVDRITIDPVVTSNKPGAEFVYWWGLYETNVQGAIPKVDTLLRTKAIDYLVVQPAKGWVLVFGAKNIKTGYTKIVTSNINVVTQFTRGWYVAKTEAGKTDLDLYLTPTSAIPASKMENVFSMVNGKKLNGKAHTLRFYHDYKALTGTSFLNTRSLFVVTDEDASVVNIGTIKEIRDFNALFYNAPAVKKPDIVTNGAQAFYFINNGKLHSIYNMSANSGQFGVQQMVNEYNADYKLSKFFYTTSFGNPLFFDELTSTFYSAGGASLQLNSVNDAATTKMSAKNNNKNLLYLGFKTSAAGFAVFQDKTNQNLRILSTITPNTSALVMINDTLAASEKLYAANIHTLLNGDENLMYFTVGNQVWSRNLSNRFEQLQYTVPGDETISFIRHLKYTIASDLAFNYNYVAVASKKGDSYNIRMFTKTSGNLNPIPVFTITGKGEAGDVMYISPFVGGSTYPNTL